MSAPMPAPGPLGDDERYEIAVSYGTIIATGGLAIIVCTTRLFVRKFMLNTFGVDDWACLFGLVFVTTFNGIGLAVVYYGAGKHIQNVPVEDLRRWFLLYYVCICMYLSISFSVKAGLLFFLRRVFQTPYMLHATFWLFIFLALFTVSGTFVAAFQCNPPRYAYDFDLLMSPERAEHCFPNMTAYAIFLYQAVVIFTCDIIMLLLPFPCLMRLNMSIAKTTALLLVFTSGVVACIAPAIRFRSLDFYRTGSSDTTFVGAASLYWMAIEYNLGLVAGSLTSLRPLFARFGVFGSSNQSKDISNKNQNFAPSYQLEDGSGKHWGSKKGSQNHRTRYQGDSVLDQTVIGDRHSNESEEARIIKTQVFTVSEEVQHGEPQWREPRAHW